MQKGNDSHTRRGKGGILKVPSCWAFKEANAYDMRDGRVAGKVGWYIINM